MAFNEDLCRDLNERKAGWMKLGLPTSGFRCECWRVDCGARFRVSAQHWQEARSQKDRFLVAPGHVARDIEWVVRKYPDFWIVDKRGEAEEVAERLE
jgi:hypothetical protein